MKEKIIDILYIIIPIIIVIMIFKFRPLFTFGESMLPTIQEGKVVIIYKTKKVKEGDIVAFSVNGVYVLHRIVEITTDGKVFFYHTQGDNNKIRDPYVLYQENILGKLLFYK